MTEVRLPNDRSLIKPLDSKCVVGTDAAWKDTRGSLRTSCGDVTVHHTSQQPISISAVRSYSALHSGLSGVGRAQMRTPGRESQKVAETGAVRGKKRRLTVALITAPPARQVAPLRQRHSRTMVRQDDAVTAGSYSLLSSSHTATLSKIGRDNPNDVESREAQRTECGPLSLLAQSREDDPPGWAPRNPSLYGEKNESARGAEFSGPPALFLQSTLHRAGLGLGQGLDSGLAVTV